MLSSIANFFFGTSNSENSDLNKNCDNEESLNETFIKESDGDDWILVNHNEKLSNETQKKQLETLSKEKEKIENNKIDEKNQSFSETLSNTNNNALEESWFITPPPCFTKKFQVALSPIENILIEHPSTSVFHRHFSLFDFMKDTNAAATRLFSQYYDHKSSDKCKKEGVRGRNRNRKQKSRRETRKDVQKRDSLDSSTSKEVRNNKNGKEQKVNKKGLDVDSDILKQRHTQKQSNYYYQIQILVYLSFIF